MVGDLMLEPANNLAVARFRTGIEVQREERDLYEPALAVPNPELRDLKGLEEIVIGMRGLTRELSNISQSLTDALTMTKADINKLSSVGARSLGAMAQTAISELTEITIRFFFFLSFSLFFLFFFFFCFFPVLRHGKSITQIIS
jgi:hypothetical protein